MKETEGVAEGTNTRSETKKSPTKFGKANPKRDLAILISFIGIGTLLCTTLLKDVGKTAGRKGHKAGKIPGRKRGKKWQGQTPPKINTEQEENSIPAGACGIYLAESSLPGGGLSLFSARFFDVGEGLPLPNSSVFFSLTDIDSRYEGAVSSVSMLLKPHPVLANVRGGYLDCGNKCQALLSQDGKRDNMLDTLVVTKRIKPGNEIFIDVSYSSALQDAFYRFSPNIPRPETVAIADAIVSDANEGLIRRKPGYGRSTARGTGFVDSGSLKVIKSISARFNEEAAALLPETSRELDKIIRSGGSTSLANLNNRTTEWLVKNGVCFDGVKVATGAVEGGGVFAARSFQKGEIVVPAPLLLTTVNSVSRAHCFGVSNQEILFCPLSFASHIKHQSATIEATENKKKECNKGPNVFLRWSPWNPRNNAAKKVHLEEALKSYGLGLSFDFVATRIIEKGEEVLLDYGEQFDGRFLQPAHPPIDQPLPLNDNILPELWK